MVFENWTSGAVSDTVDANLTLNQEYQIKLEHFESGGPGSLWLYWSYGSVSQTNVTFETNYVSSPSVVSGSPFTVTVLSPICGNGTRDSGEECDDGNYNDSDG